MNGAYIGAELRDVSDADKAAEFDVVSARSRGFFVTALMFNLFQPATLQTRFLLEKPSNQTSKE